MRQFRLRTIMALIVIIAVSMWVGMLIERSRQPPRSPLVISVSSGPRKFKVISSSPTRAAPAVSGEEAKP
jgi:hypothetical protein